jgi:hypothetical protein
MPTFASAEKATSMQAYPLQLVDMCSDMGAGARADSCGFTLAITVRNARGL